MRWARHVACIGKRKWEDNKVDLKEIGCEYVHWIHLAQDSFCIFSDVSKKSGMSAVPKEYRNIRGCIQKFPA
jgi:hypothetical protein